jgi:hypothetical protein
MCVKIPDDASRGPCAGQDGVLTLGAFSHWLPKAERWFNHAIPQLSDRRLNSILLKADELRSIFSPPPSPAGRKSLEKHRQPDPDPTTDRNRYEVVVIDDS